MKQICALIAASGVASSVVAAPAEAGPAERETETVYYDWLTDDGELRGGRVELPTDPAWRERPGGQISGAADNRLDLVFVGDGYTANQIGLYNSHVDSVLDDLFFYEPFKSYEPYFRVTRVEVVSNESGVDNDPVQGIDRDTELGMRYWCNGIERLLCVNVSAAYAYANTAPDVDQVIALANSTKYGGAGYSSSNLGTAAGGNGAAAQIAIHELGHSLGDLADEYTYGGPTVYQGGEPSDANASLLNASQMAAQNRKWAAWLGENRAGFDGPVDTFEGAVYSELGVYRPSNNSMMRALGRPFNLPSAEALIGEIYREVSPIDGFSPAGGSAPAGSVVSVTPMQPLGFDLEITWLVNGSVVPGQSGTTLDLGLAGASGGDVVTARVVDQTDMVRDETMRASRMTAEVSWSVEGAACAADLAEPFATLDIDDVLAFLDAFAAGLSAADLAVPNGILNIDDVLAFLNSFASGCP